MIGAFKTKSEDEIGDVTATNSKKNKKFKTSYEEEEMEYLK